MRKPTPIPEQLLNMLDIPEDGRLPIWKQSPGKFVPVGSVAGTVNSRGYRVVWFNRKPYLYHRVAFKKFYNEEPVIVDHRDGNIGNNSKANLRAATHKQNVYNRKSAESTSSIYKGVSYRPGRNKWVAAITKDYERRYLGIFDSEIDAANAYDKAALRLHGSYARLNFP